MYTFAEATSFRGSKLLGVQLDDELFVQLDLDQLFTLGLLKDAAPKSFAVNFHPVRRGRAFLILARRRGFFLSQRREDAKNGKARLLTV